MKKGQEKDKKTARKAGETDEEFLERLRKRSKERLRKLQEMDRNSLDRLWQS